MFVKVNGKKFVILLVYMGDLFITCDDVVKFLQTNDNLLVYFQVTELEQLKHFIGLQVDCNTSGIKCQDGCICN